MDKQSFLTTITGGLELNQSHTRRWLLAVTSLFSGLALALLLSLAAHEQATAMVSSTTDEMTGVQSPDEVVWLIEYVTDNPYFYEMTDHALARDSDNRFHYAYGGDHLYYAYFDGTNWNKEVVDPIPNVGAFASIAVDLDDNPHIAYYDALNGTLKYAYNGGGGWFIHTVDNTVDVTPTMSAILDIPRQSIQTLLAEDNLPMVRVWLDPDLASDSDSLLAPSAVDKGVGQYTSIAIDSNGWPHISYYQFELVPDPDFNKLKYAHWNGIMWATQVVSQTGSVGNKREGKYTSIALDSLDHPHIFHLDDDYDDLRHSYIGEGGRWNFENIEDGATKGNVGGWISAVIDGSNVCNVSFYDKTHGNLLFSRRNKCHLPPSESPGWNTEAIDSTGDVGKYTSLTRKGDQFFISYFDETNDRPKYAWNASGDWGAWSRGNITSTVGGGIFTSAIFDKNGYPHVTYFDFANGLLREAYRKSGTTSWQFRTIDVNHDVGLASSLDLNAANVPFISYLDDSLNDLMLAERTSGSWAFETISGTREIGNYSSLKIDSTGIPHVAFYDASKKNLHYGVKNGTWDTQSVDRAWDVGKYPSLALNNADTPYISYYDESAHNLNYAYLDATVWITDDVDIGIDDVGKFSSIAIDGSSELFISYYDEGNTKLKMAYKPGLFLPWSEYTIDGTNSPDSDDVGWYTSIGLSPIGEPRIAYFDKMEIRLKFAEGTWNGGLGIWEFTIEIVDETPGFINGMYASLGVDSTDMPHISYYRCIEKLDDGGNPYCDPAGGDLMYARRVGGIWEIYTIDSEGDVGLFTSLALDGLNRPHVSYYDKSMGELKYASYPFFPTGVYYIPLVMR